jgi:hypothetical protein
MDRCAAAQDCFFKALRFSYPERADNFLTPCIGALESANKN